MTIEPARQASVLLTIPKSRVSSWTRAESNGPAASLHGRPESSQRSLTGGAISLKMAASSDGVTWGNVNRHNAQHEIHILVKCRRARFPCSFVARALVRAASTLVSTPPS
ncbi:MAG TPA: hypothetical protein VNX18_11415 [Bryobacteraceae bacterium]|nr:hypothetical protein [Bryobacteraceae bacterium]